MHIKRRNRGTSKFIKKVKKQVNNEESQDAMKEVRKNN